MNIETLRELRRKYPFLTLDIEQKLARTRFVRQNAGVELFFQGAHISRFDAAHGGSPLFLSRHSSYLPGKAIRGGIPLCFPWFGPKADDPDAPAHGFARTSEWQLESADADGLKLTLQSDEQTRQLWPHEFRANYRIGLDADHLRVALDVHNMDTMPFTFEAVLHTYFRVSDARAVSIDGLDGKTYIDKVAPIGRKEQKSTVYIEGETDRVYLDSPGPITLRDGERTVRISNLGGWKSTVVWNPWVEKARALKDLGDEEWTQFVCIESGMIADDAITLAPGDFYTLEIEIEAASSH